MVRPDYIDHCIAVVQELDPDEVSQLGILDLIGRSETLFSAPTAVYALGNIATPRGLLHLAFKDSAHSKYRVQNELVGITIITERLPDMLPKFPSFIGSLAIEGSNQTLGIITEDASRGGASIPRAKWTSNEVINALGRAFDYCGRLTVFDRDTLERRIAFDVGGTERLLDMYPSVFNTQFKIENRDLYMETFERAMDAEEQLVLNIEADTPLARSVLDELGHSQE